MDHIYCQHRCNVCPHVVGLPLAGQYPCTPEEQTRFYGETRSERVPLLSQKDDDLSSWCSSYDSMLLDDEDDPGSLEEGKPLKDGECKNNTKRLCAICFDAPRDRFFLPCGHSVACFECGTRIAELAGTCPICRMNMKKVRKIFTVCNSTQSSSDECCLVNCSGLTD